MPFVLAAALLVKGYTAGGDGFAAGLFYGMLTGKDTRRTVEVNVAGVNQLRLVVTDGGNGNKQTLEMYNVRGYFTAEVNLPKGLVKSSQPSTNAVTVSARSSGGRRSAGMKSRRSNHLPPIRSVEFS